ncbi:MAG: hypothetical protein JXQ82_02000, partial [Methanomicrobiaceae archaeon]|nr:hypothetical protein [Methanomicrobiaceae archaeon]
SRMEDHELLEYITVKYLPFTAEYINTLERTLTKFNKRPAKWAGDVEDMMIFLENHMKDPDFFLPAELRPAGSPGKVINRLKDYIYKYGEMLKAWPEIWHAARELNHEV